MKIAMIGSGAAGSVFAAYLKKGGGELWLIDKYKAHMDKIAEYGEELGIPTPCCTVLSQIVRCIQGNYENQYLADYMKYNS